MRRILLLAVLALPACDMLSPSATAPASAPPKAKAPSAAAPAPAPAAGASGHGPQIVLGQASGAAGQRVKVSATLRSGGQSIAGTQNDIAFAPSQVAIAANAKGRPDCTANGALQKEGTAFSFLPSGCKPGSCTSVRALVLSLSNVEPIDDGAVLYTCQVQIAAGASGTQPLSLSHVGFSSPKGGEISGGGVNGSVSIGK